MNQNNRDLQQVLGSSGKAATESHEDNPLRQGLWRYWGYINEIAEAMTHVIQKSFGVERGQWIVNPLSYRVVDAYAWLDGLASAARAYKKGEDKPRSERVFDAVEAGGDAYLFQQFASVYVPATIVSGIRKGSENALKRLDGQTLAKAGHSTGKNVLDKALGVIEKAVSDAFETGLTASFRLLKAEGLGKRLAQNARIRVGVPMALALIAIPLVIQPIDWLAHRSLDVTFRPLMKGLRHLLFGRGSEVEHPVIVNNNYMFS